MFNRSTTDRRRPARHGLPALAALLVVAALIPAESQAATKNVVAVGNAFGGTVSFLDGATFNNLGSFNIAPDRASRRLALLLNPITAIGFQVVKSERGGENYVDDLALSPDGTKLYVSRGILADVAAFDLRTKRMLWRKDIGGFSADHMAINANGSRIIVGDITNSNMKVFDTASGSIVAQFNAGTYGHGVDYSADYSKIYVGSIGTISLPYELNFLKGDRQITIVNASNYSVLKTYKYDYGVRPFAVTPDDRFMFMQQSFNRGFAEVDLGTGAITRRASLPSTPAGDALWPNDLPRDSMHHGLALSGDSQKICNAGTIDNYVAVVKRSDFKPLQIVAGQSTPYWATTSQDGNSCLVSNSTGNNVTVFSYATGAQTKRVTVGNYPQRMRVAKLDTSVALASSAG